jgi:hypothetical protein
MVSGPSSPCQLWDDLADVIERIKPDFDATAAEAPAAGQQVFFLGRAEA